MSMTCVSRMSLSIPVLVSVLVSVLALGCEEGGKSDPQPRTQAPSGGAQSAYGKAQERAERLKGEIDDYQQEVIRQADSVFDASAPRIDEGNGPSDSGG